MAGSETEGRRDSQRRSQDPQTDSTETTDLSERKEKLDADVDALLDEIDDVLEVNAEEFVRGFVQKGGQ